MSKTETERPFIPDEAQREVIEAPPGDFLLVTAPPGAGKTAVACARIVALTRQGVEASNIMMLSFTRVAVGEFRRRIEVLAENDDTIHGVEITTLDSNAWRILKGIDEERSIEDLFGDYEDNIERVLVLLRDGNPMLEEALGTFRHLLVDEAQDLTGTRAELVLELIRFLRRSGAGVTVFADPAQAIYGFTCVDDEDGTTDLEQQFLPMLDGSDLHPRRLALTEIHRTDKENLNRLFKDARVYLGAADRSALESYRGARATIDQHKDGALTGYFSEHKELHQDDDRLVLYRRRFEVLLDSSFLTSAGVPHRLRLSGFPHAVAPWIGAVLSMWTEPLLREDEFVELWEGRQQVEAVASSGLTAGEAWQLLARLRVMKKGRLELRRLRRILGRSRPPLEVASPVLGHRGPILGTIHAAKGTEAAHVTMMMPPEPGENSRSDHEEEARVLYVAATRAKQTLLTGKGASAGCKQLKSGRLFAKAKTDGKAQLELGREGDLDLASTVSRSLFADDDEAVECQEMLAGLAYSTFELTAVQNPGQGWRYEVERSDTEGLPIACLTQRVNGDLFEVAKLMRGRLSPPKCIPHLSGLGCTTVCLAEDDARLEELCEPFNQTGIFLAPVIKGLSMVYFRTKRK